MAVATRTDEEIKKNIVDELYWDDRVDAADVNVSIHEGRVVLSGTVPTHAARRAAEDDARAILGAGEIENRLMVKHPTWMSVPSDEEVETSIKNMLRWDATIDASDIRAVADAGWVTLRGTVPALWQKLKAEDVALGVRGVRGATNELAVVPSQKHEDREIAEQIEAALERNVYVDPDQVDVKVSDGVVILTGTLSDRRAYRAARDAAHFTPGVIDVINELTVEE
jgi:osmotically-inducible protein OsmY